MCMCVCVLFFSSHFLVSFVLIPPLIRRDHMELEREYHSVIVEQAALFGRVQRMREREREGSIFSTASIEGSNMEESLTDMVRIFLCVFFFFFFIENLLQLSMYVDSDRNKQ